MVALLEKRQNLVINFQVLTLFSHFIMEVKDERQTEIIINNIKGQKLFDD